jgi:hypothetical protein
MNNNEIEVKDIQTGMFIVYNNRPCLVEYADYDPKKGTSSYIVSDIFNKNESQFLLTKSNKVEVPIITQTDYIVNSFEEIQNEKLKTCSIGIGDRIFTDLPSVDDEDTRSKEIKTLFERDGSLTITLLSSMGIEKVINPRETVYG